MLEINLLGRKIDQLQRDKDGNQENKSYTTHKMKKVACSDNKYSISQVMSCLTMIINLCELQGPGTFSPRLNGQRCVLLY